MDEDQKDFEDCNRVMCFTDYSPTTQGNVYAKDLKIWIACADLKNKQIAELEKKLELAVEALELIGGKMEYYCAIGDHSKQCAAQEALEKIKGTK